MTSSTPAVTREDVDIALRARFAAPEWALLFEVRNGTGFSRSQVRTADAIAMGLWPSHGLELHGFEIKVSRSDWLRERKDPAKAEEIAKYCDRWSLVIGAPEIVQPGELPPAWGLFVLRNGKLRCEKEAAKLEPKPLDRLLLASLLRRAQEASAGESEIRAAAEAARAAARKEAEDRVREFRESMLAQEDLLSKRLQARISAFEEASGIRIDHNVVKLGEAVRFVLDGGVEKLRADLRLHVEKLEWMALSARTVLDGKLADGGEKAGDR